MNIQKKTRIKLLVTAFLSLAFGIYIILSNFNSNIIFFYSPSDILIKDIDSKNVIRIGGLVKENSIVYKENHITLFTLTDLNQNIEVKYTGTLPPMFRDTQGIVAKGYLESKSLFIAEELLTKHDENYMPKEVVDSLKKSGKWQHEEEK